MPYLQFPSLDALTLALLSQTLPGKVQVDPCTAYRFPSGEIVVGTDQKLAAGTVQALSQFGVQVVRQPKGAQLQSVSQLNATCWSQLLPLEKSPRDLEAELKTVLIRVNSVEKFTSLASEILRLGNDRISYRGIEVDVPSPTAEQQAHDSAILMRVIEPPYYSLVDVVDAACDSVSGRSQSEATAYREQAPRVWVRVGYRHPMADRIDPPAGHFLLIDPPHEFQFVAEAAFHDIYQALDVRMPQPAHVWQAQEVTQRIAVPLKLTSAGQSSPVQLWVIKQSAMNQLEQLLVRSDDELLQQLLFAVVPADPEPLVILRVRPARGAPPILVLDAVGYHQYLRLPNLFVPAGMRLQPPLRRDAVVKLLASDSRMITWLDVAESTDGNQRSWAFRAQTVPDAAFRPLSDWIEYVLDHHGRALDAWSQSHRFQFEAFVCKEDVREAQKAAPNPSRATASSATESATKSTATKAQEKAEAQPAEPLPLPELDNSVQPARASTAGLIEQLKQTEEQFLKSTEPLDSPVRVPLWQRLAWLNSQLKHSLDATICWANLLWCQNQLTAESSHHWLQSELRNSGRSRVDIEVIRSVLSKSDNQGKEVGLVAAYVVRAVANQQGRTELRAIAPDLTRYFLQQERVMPVRVVWLTALAMHELVGGDALGLARVRDRLLDRLYQHGLLGEFDVASFLRGSGQAQSDQHRLLRVNWQKILTLITKWLTDPIMSKNQTRVYVKFVLAYCLVRIGEVVSGRELLNQAMEELHTKDLIHLWMGMAFNFRIEQAAQGGNNREPLPEELVRQLEHMDRLDRYKIDRMRQHSRVLEPHDRIDAYRRWHRRYTDDLFQVLAELKDQTDLKQIEAKLRQLLGEYTSGQRGLRVLATALEYAPRLGDDFATPMMKRVSPLLVECDDVIEKALLIQRALYVAAHFGHMTQVNLLIASLRNELPGIVESYLQIGSQFNPADKERVETVENLLQFSFRGLRKLGIRDELSALYAHIAELVDQHDVRAQPTGGLHSANMDNQLSRRLSLLLCVASGYFYFGKNEEGDRTIAKVRSVLLTGRLSSIEQRRVACAYAMSVSLGRADTAVQRIVELFQRTTDGQRLLPKIEDTMTTSSHFSVSELELIESCMLSLLSEESALDQQSQLWLDQDEFAIRKKIHGDMAKALNQ